MSSVAIGGSIQDSNKKVVSDFYNLAFNEHKPSEAMAKFIGEKYIQHNPYAGEGKRPFIDFFRSYYSENKEAFVEIKRIIAENGSKALKTKTAQPLLAEPFFYITL